MKTKLHFYAIQKFKNSINLNGFFTFLILFFMTVSSFGQGINGQYGIVFELCGATITFGAPTITQGQPYEYPIGTAVIGTVIQNNWELVYEGAGMPKISWALKGPTDQAGTGARSIYYFIYETSACSNMIYPSDDLTAVCWEEEIACGGLTSITYTTPTGDPDSDGDGVPDADDVCPGFDDNLDADADSIPDGCDICPGFDDTADADGDAIPDGCEADSDGDGVIDDNDVCPGFDDKADVDGDSKPDDCDNCPNDANADQADTDNDGIGDVCDEDGPSNNDFVIVAEEEVHLHGNNVVTGNVGATDYDGKIKLHEFSTVSGSIEASEVEINNGSSAGSTILAPAVVDLPPFVFNLVSNDSDFDITVEQGQTITLNDQIYGKIEVKEGGTLFFNNSNVFIEELKAYNNTTIAFTGCTNLFINKKVKFEDNTEFNSNGESVTMYVDDDVIVEEGSNVTAFIYANKYIEAKSKDENPVSMTGFFSGKKVKGEKAVSWQGQSGYIPCEIIEPEITEEDLCDCKDGMVSLTIAYIGTGVLSTNSGVIDNNQDGTYTISNYGDKLDKDLEISDGDGELSSFATIHTSCSQEILNVTYDEAFTVISYTDNIGNTCEVNFSSKAAFEGPKDELVLEFKVSVWPNPTNNLFNIKMITPNSIDKVHLKTFDINGRLIHSNIINGNEDYQFGEQLSSGIYFVRLSQADISKVIKVIKR